MLILDGTFLVYKSYYVAEKIKKNHGVTDTEHYQKIARNIFLKMVAKVRKKVGPTHLWMVFDGEGKNFRHDLLPSYKGNRKEKPTELLGIKEEIYDFLTQHDIPFQIGEGVEGDDLIASFTHQHPDTAITIFTGDADLAALVNHHTTVLLDKKEGWTLITPHNFRHHFPVPASRFPDFKALQGDKSDFLKGVDGLFRNEVLHLFMEFGSVETFFTSGEHHYLYEKMMAEKESILINKAVATLKRDCVLSVDFAKTRVERLTLPERIAQKVGW